MKKILCCPRCSTIFNCFPLKIKYLPYEDKIKVNNKVIAIHKHRARQYYCEKCNYKG